MINKDQQSLDICFEDASIVVVNKPSGVLSQPGKTVDGSIATLASAAFPEATGPLLVHRLDMDTSGLLILAKSRDVHRHLQQQFEKRLITKRYIALLTRSPVGLGGRVQLPLRLDINNRPAQIVCHQFGKSADTLWRYHSASSTVASHSAAGVRVVFTPITGRTHQLRVHAAHPQGLNAPIAGDRLYGQSSSRLMLHAERIAFTHPVSLSRINVHSPAPF